MHRSLYPLAVTAILGITSLASASYQKYPYGCAEMDAKQGFRHVYQYTGSCSLRQHPDTIEQCKKRVIAGDSTHFERIEKSLVVNCKNRNGYLRTTSCLSNHTFTAGEPASATWHYQSAVGYYCYYN